MSDLWINIPSNSAQTLTEACRQEHPSGYTCTRLIAHEGAHIAQGHAKTVTAVWS